MKNKKTAITILFFLGLIALLSSFYYSRSLNERVQFSTNYHKLLKNCENEAISFESALTSTHNKEKLKRSYFLLRKEYKKVSFLNTYLDKHFTLKNINGAPLPKLEKNVPEIIVLAPKGFQVLDELFASPESKIDEIEKTGHKLCKDLVFQCQGLNTASLDSRQTLEALRLALIEHLSLGITGFDTPGSLNGVKEVEYSLLGMQDLIKNTKLTQSSISKTLKKALVYLDKNDSSFEDFNRYKYIKNYLLPLYQAVVKYHKSSQIEFAHEVLLSRLPINYEAENPFDKDFLNADYYTSLSLTDNTSEITKLGKSLFYDPILSQNNERTCSSCHQPEKYFTDGLKANRSFDKTINLNRNSPTLLNAVYAEKYFWDLRSNSLAGQFEHVIFNDKEFNTSTKEIITRLKKSSEYQSMFDSAYKDMDFMKEKINPETIKKSLESYVQSLVGLNSKFDQAMHNELDLTADEISGFNIFMGKGACGTCHFAPTFSGLVPPFFEESESEVLGVPQDKSYTALDSDFGRSNTGMPKEEVAFYNHSFKTVTVRNSAKTAPYMHNGVYDSLEEVMEFYNNGGGTGHGLTVDNQTLASDSLGLTPVEIKQIISFIKTLTDTTTFHRPVSLPAINYDTSLTHRKIGGTY